MQKIILTFGVISGLVISAMFVLTIPFIDDLSFGVGAIIGYTSMIAAGLLIYFGIRSYRDNVGGGMVRFGRAFAIGMLIVVVSNVLYVTTWEIVRPRFMPNFYAKYEAAAVKSAQDRGASAAEITKIHEQMVMYQKPLINVLLTFLEPLPVGLIVTLISSWILSRRRSAGTAPVPAT